MKEEDEEKGKRLKLVGFLVFARHARLPPV